MSLHAYCELSCDDVWCSMCFCVCVSFLWLCGVFTMDCVMLRGMCILCGVGLCAVCCSCLNVCECVDCDIWCDVIWFGVVFLLVCLCVFFACVSVVSFVFLCAVLWLVFALRFVVVECVLVCISCLCV